MRELKYLITCKKFCAQVNTYDDADELITFAAPCYNKFKGQPITALLNWLDRTFGWYYIERIGE